MIRINDITTAWANLIGWNQHHITSSDYAVEEELLDSISYKKYQSYHPMLTLDNIYSIMPRGYVFSDYLRQKVKESIEDCVQSFYNEKMINATVKGLLETRTLFDGAGRLSELITPTNSLVGLALTPARGKGVSIRIDKIGLQFKGTGVIKMYLMHSSSPIVQKTISLTRTSDGGMQWFNQIDLYLPYQSATTDAGGVWYLVYDEKELGTQQAVNKGINWASTPCNTCGGWYDNWVQWSKYMSVMPFKVKKDGEIVAMFDIDQMIQTGDYNYGINLSVSVHCDLTDTILDNAEMFVDTLGLTLANKLLREMAYNPNGNLERNTLNITYNQQHILYELDGDSSSYKKSGLLYRLDCAKKALSLGTEGIDKICLPCKKKGIRYSTL